MKRAAQFRCSVGFIALLAVSAVNGLGATRKSRVLTAQFESVWTAAVDVAKEGFLPDRVSREEGKLRFRTGPLRGYRFDVVIIDVGAGKTRVEIELRGKALQGVKDAWHSGDRYLSLVALRSRKGGK
jgi:hypothetical protein